MEPMKPMTPLEQPEKWWPPELGSASASGKQNKLRYAFFADKRRLIVEREDGVTTYKTGDHQISGVSQTDSESRSIEFTSQHGRLLLAELEVAG
jgi:hypothetical protein